MSCTITIEKFKAKDIPENLWEQLTVLINDVKKVSDPQDPENTIEGIKGFCLNCPEHIGLKILVAKKNGQNDPIGLVYLFFNPGAYADITAVRMFVPKTSFESSVYNTLVEKIYDVAKDSGRTLVMLESASTLPALEDFLSQIGAEKKQESKQVRLFIKDIDWGLISDWSQHVPEKFSLEIYHSPVPEDKIGEKLELVNLGINLMPHDNLELEASTMTKEQIRDEEEAYLKSNGGEYTILARHSSGEAVGYTEMIYADFFPYNFAQAMTVVKSKFRGNGLGRLMKARMLEHIRDRHPQLLWISTGNATTNASMRRINEELGFRLYKTVNYWQMPVTKLGEYLENKL